MKNITFKELKIQNFLSFGKEVIIPFTDGINLITGINLDRDDGNGVGKSAIVDAFFFVLFGDTLKELKKEAIVNDLAQKNCKVTLTFTINKNGVVTPYIIERGLAPSYCRLYVNGTEDKTLSTIPVTNNYILNLINSTPSVFRNIIAMSVNSSNPFMALGKTAKREFIEGLLRLELFSIMKKVAKEEYDIMFKEYELIVQKYEENNRNMILFTERKNNFEKNRVNKIEDLQKRKLQYEADVVKLLNTLTPAPNANVDEQYISQYETKNTILLSLEAQHKDALKETSRIEAQYNVGSKQISDIENKLKTYTKQWENAPRLDDVPVSRDGCAGLITLYKDEIADLEIKIATAISNIRHYNDDINSIRINGSFCDKCKRAFTDTDIKTSTDQITLLEKQISDTAVEYNQNQIKIASRKQTINMLEVLWKIYELQEEKQKLVDENTKRGEILQLKQDVLRKLEADYKILKEELQKIQKLKEDAQLVFERNKSILRLIDSHTKSISNCMTDITHVENEKNEFETMLDNAEGQKKAMEVQIEGYKERVKIYDTIKFVVSDEGVRSYIVKKLLNILNSRLAYYLKKLDANIKSFTFNEFFEDTIIDDKGMEKSYHNFSDGEQKRIDLSCMYAFMDLRRIQGDVTFNLAFYDELLDSALSVKGLKLLFDILKERIDKYHETAYIITHKKENLHNDLINNVIFLQKSGGITKLGKP